MKLFKERAGLISPYPIWVPLAGGYMYISHSLLGVLWQALTEWKSDYHLVG